MLLNVSNCKVSDFFNMMNIFVLFYRIIHQILQFLYSFAFALLKIKELFGVRCCLRCHFFHISAECLGNVFRHA